MKAAIDASNFMMPMHVRRSFLMMTPPRIVPIAPAGSSTSPAARDHGVGPKRRQGQTEFTNTDICYAVYDRASKHRCE